MTVATKTAPKEIWLQIGDDSDHHNKVFPTQHDAITWCQDSAMGCEVKYIRSDFVERKPLTDDEIGVVLDEAGVPDYKECKVIDTMIVRAIERAHGIGEGK